MHRNPGFSVYSKEQLNAADPDRKWFQQCYSFNIARWLTACRKSHSDVCSCNNWRGHWWQLEAVQKTDRETQTEDTGGDTKSSVSDDDSFLASLLNGALPSRKRPSSHLYLVSEDSTSKHSTPKKKKQKKRVRFPQWCTPELVTSGEDTSGGPDSDPDITPVDEGMLDHSAIGRSVFHVNGMVYENSSVEHF